jgi:nucleoid-associated protein YgaU
MRSVCLCLTALALLPAWGLSTRAQDPAPAALRLEQQDLEERLRRQKALLEELQETQDAQRRRIDRLVEEIKAVRLQATSASEGAVTREDLKKIYEKLREVDQKREEDKELILKEIQKLAKAPASVPEKKSEPEPPPPKDETGYEYIIQPGDTLSDLVTAFRDKGVKVTLKQVLDANPGLDPKKLRVGQKVFVPTPAKTAN